MIRNRESGVTLIELLIAVSLLSLLSVGMLVAMRIGFSTMDKVDEHLVRNRRAANARKIIENEIQGFTLTLADWHSQPDRVVTAPFVEWESDHMRFVTAYSLQDAWRGRRQIAEMQVIPGAKGEGVRLIVNETPYTGSAQTGTRITLIDTEPHFAPILPGPMSFVLSDQLAYCRFEYLQGEPLAWQPEWRKAYKLPKAVRIDMAPLHLRHGEIEPGQVVVQMNVDREPTGYSDAQ